MDGRTDRIKIPSLVAVISFGLTLLLASGFRVNWAFLCSACGTDDILVRLVGGTVITVGVGYLCNVPFNWLQFNCRGVRFVDFSKFMLAFGLKYDGCSRGCHCCDCCCSCCFLSRCFRTCCDCPQDNQEQRWRVLEDALLGEFHLRLHSHAPKKLIDFCTRRNTAWYMANISAIASVAGAAFALLLLCCFFPDSVSAEKCSILGSFLSVLVFFFLVPCALYQQGKKWNREFWEVCWKWIYWDRQVHPIPDDWKLFETLPDGVRRCES